MGIYTKGARKSLGGGTRPAFSVLVRVRGSCARSFLCCWWSPPLLFLLSGTGVSVGGRPRLSWLLTAASVRSSASGALRCAPTLKA